MKNKPLPDSKRDFILLSCLYPQSRFFAFWCSHVVHLIGFNRSYAWRRF
jgi:hypothetical protein